MKKADVAGRDVAIVEARPIAPQKLEMQKRTGRRMKEGKRRPVIIEAAEPHVVEGREPAVLQTFSNIRHCLTKGNI